MNYKKIPSLLLLLFLAFMVNAQQPQKLSTIAAWKIGYQLDFGSTERQLAPDKDGHQEQSVMIELAKALSGSSDDTLPLICYVSPNYIRVEQNGLGGGITVADKRDTLSYLLDTAAKTAVKYPAEIPKLHTQLNEDSLVVISSEGFKMELHKDTSSIGGQLCKKAVFSNPDFPQNVITVWYAPALPRLYWQKYSYLKNVPGCALSIGTISKGVNVGIKAKLVEKVNMPESFFKPPSDYAISEGMF